MIPSASLLVCDTEEELQRSAAAAIVDSMRQSIRERGTCVVALSGGESPRPIYRLLGMSPLREMVEWGRVHLLFGDERMVPPGDIQSNYSMVERELLLEISIPPENVHRIAGEKKPVVAAREYERCLRDLFSGGPPRIDCVLLGLGEDGHTASLFPGSTVLRERVALIRPVFRRSAGAWRVTMTLPLINAARKVVFVVSGNRKAGIMGRVSRARRPTFLLPATLVQPVDGEVVWMADRQAASELTHQL